MPWLLTITSGALPSIGGLYKPSFLFSPRTIETLSPLLELDSGLAEPVCWKKSGT